MTRLTGQDLLRLPRTAEAIIGAGYIRPDGRPAWAAFYEALLAERGHMMDTADWLNIRECAIERGDTVTARVAHLLAGPPDGIVSGCPDLGIYVTCLASCNAGRLHGSWIDLDEITEADEIRACIDWVIATSPVPDAEEHAIHDNAGLPRFLAGEYPSLSDLADYAQNLSELSSDDETPYRLWCENCSMVVDLSSFQQSYAGQAEYGARFAMDHAYETVPGIDSAEWPFSCIDWVAAWRELGCTGLRDGIGSPLYVFWE